MKDKSMFAAIAAMAIAAFGGEPVTHLGIFINDEDWSLRPWRSGISAWKKASAPTHTPRYMRS